MSTPVYYVTCLWLGVEIGGRVCVVDTRLFAPSLFSFIIGVCVFVLFQKDDMKFMPPPPVRKSYGDDVVCVVMNILLLVHGYGESHDVAC